MSDLKVGDIVARKSYGYDIFFKVVDITGTGSERIITLKGISYRIEADAPESDLEVQPESRVREYRDKCCRKAKQHSADKRLTPGYAYYSAPYYRGLRKKAYYRDTANDTAEKIKRPGKVLHLDGDKDYLENCMAEYKKLGIEVIGEYVPEKEQPQRVAQLLAEHRPDILVLTGHDGFIKGHDSYNNLASYRTSRYFIDAVKTARRFNSDMDGLVIFAGACQSLYREIINAGANFASAPFRDLIHALDPVRVCQKIAFTGVDSILDAEDVIKNTITGKTGIGGVQTRGKYREGFPAEPYQ
ncbi:MAG: sporulation peptidase YabG [Clostridiaceae bacterium]|jgi:spore coat assembly protein|nr:sporulation peptidase YabG [Clostridiaceae bacterium]